MTKLLEGFVGSSTGAPLDAIGATVKKVSDGSTVTTGATDATGHWSFSGLPTADEYFVTLVDGAGRAVVRGPWSGELRSAWVRDRLEMPDTGVAVLPSTTFLGAVVLPAGSVSAPAFRWATGSTPTNDGMYRPVATFSTAFAHDAARILGIAAFGIDVVGEVLASGALTTEGALTVAGTTTLTGAVTVASKSVAASPDAGNSLAWNTNGFYVPDFLTAAEGNTAYATAAHTHTAAYVDVGGDTMTGALNLVQTSPTFTALTSRDDGDTNNRIEMRVDGRLSWGPGNLTVDTILERGSAGVLTLGGSALVTLASGDARYTVIGHNHDTSYVLLAGGSVMTGLLGPTASNTHDLGTTALRWRKLWAVDGEFTNTPTVGGVALPTSTHNHDAAYVNVGGDTMTGALTISSGDLTLSAGRLNITQANAGLEFGARGSSNTPFFDFHSGAVDVDFDVRLLASGGTGAQGMGTLTVDCGTMAVAGDQTISGTLGVTGAATFATAPTVGGSALLTATAADALFLTPAEGTAAYATTAHDHAAAYVDVGGDTMSGALQVNSTLGATGLATLGAGLNVTGEIVADAASGNAITGQSTLSIVTGGQGQLVAYDDTAMAIDVGGTLTFRGKYTAAGAPAGFGGIKAGKENATDGNLDTYLALYTRSQASGIQERLRVSSTGLATLGAGLAVTGNLTLTTSNITQSSSAILTNTLIQATADVLGPRTNFYKSRGTVGSPGLVADGDILGDIAFYGWDGNSHEAAALIRCQVFGTAADGDMPGVLRFFTTPDGSTAITERMTIWPTGLVQVNNGLTVSAGGAAITGSTTITGAAQITGNLNLSAATSILEMGSTAGANTPGIDFHSSGNANDYDVRMLASGGLAGVGNGTLTIHGHVVHNGFVGFYNTAAQAKPTVSGARASNAALTSLCTALATLGLITNSTTT